MPFYGTKQPGNVGVFPQRPKPRELTPDEIVPGMNYALLTKQQLIDLCDERGITGPKGKLPMNQKKGYYVEQLKKLDRIQHAKQ